MAALLAVLAAMIVLLVRLQERPPDEAADETPTRSASHPSPQPRRETTSVDVLAPVPIRIEGRVVDEHEGPVAGATILVRDAVPYPSSPDADLVAVADDNGEFAIDLSGGQYLFLARSGVRVSRPVHYWTAAPDQPLILQVRQGKVVDVLVVRHSDEQPIEGAVVRNAGLVERTDGRGIARLEGAGGGELSVEAEGYADGVTFVGETSPTVFVRLVAGVTYAGTVIGPLGPVANAQVVAQPEYGTIAIPIAVQADTSGRWRARLPARSRYTLKAMARGFVPNGGFEVRGTAHDDIVLRVQRGTEVSGTVVRLDGTPVAGAHVTAFETAQWRSEETITNSSGEFLLYTPNARRWDVVATTGSEVAVGVSGVGITLVAEPLTHMIRGVVVDEADVPVADVPVRASTRLPMFAGQARTDESGEFEIGPFPDMSYTVSVTDRAAKGVTNASPEMRHRFVVARGTEVTGRVLVDGQPLRDYHLFEQGLRAGPHASRDLHVQDADGRFTIQLQGHGSRTLSVAAPAVQPRTIAVTLAPGERIDAGTIELVTAERLVGRVVSEGRGVRGARVSISAAPFSDVYATHTDDNGAFSISQTTTPLTLFVTHSILGGTHERITVRDDVVVHLERPKTGSIAGRLSPGWRLEFYVPDTSYISPISPEVDHEAGTYSIMLAPGTYDAVVWTHTTNEDDIIVVSPVTSKKVTVVWNETTIVDFER